MRLQTNQSDTNTGNRTGNLSWDCKQTNGTCHHHILLQAQHTVQNVIISYEDGENLKVKLVAPDEVVHIPSNEHDNRKKNYSATATKSKIFDELFS